ncbi:MAG: AsnC family protein [Gammaproteobacteria bacterium]|nr:AsnC family protein [Gammaproteobacteria bacterium]
MLDERKLIAALQHGLPLVSHPYAAIAEQIGSSETEVIEYIQAMKDRGDIKRLGVVVRHRKLGYTANAMVVWDIPDERVDEMGHCFGRFDFVTLSYRRPRHLPDWPYNLFCMIHGRDRDDVMKNLQLMIANCCEADIKYSVLFSNRCFKQRGAIYIHSEKTEAVRA